MFFALGPWPLLDSASIALLRRMTSEPNPSRVLYENLDTSFVNLWALLRYLSQRSFIGRVHVELDNYTADVVFNGSKTPRVHEVDRKTGSDVIEEAVLHRLVLRARESPGSISVYEDDDEATASKTEQAATKKQSVERKAEEETVTSVAAPASRDQLVAETRDSMGSTFATESNVDAGAEVMPTQPATEAEWNDVVRVSGELVAGINQLATATGADFAALFRESRIALADDYTFLDPVSSVFEYENFSVNINSAVPPKSYVAGVSESLRRVVDQLASGERPRRMRERVALELARIARRNDDAFTRSGFKAQLDRIAGTKVI
jgi:hypothetical protein